MSIVAIFVSFYSSTVSESIHAPILADDQRPTANDAYPFFAALFAAFNGSTVAEPANPRRSRGGFFAFVITRYPPFGPGTLPSTTSRLSSLSTPRMRRLRVVTRALPMCPDIRMPLKTRDGNADEPIEPVIWNIEPCDFGPPPK